MENSSQLPPFRDTRKVAFWVILLLGLEIVLSLVNIVLSGAELVLASRYPEAVQAALSSEEVDLTELPGGLRQLGISLLTLATAIVSFFGFIATVVVFLVWMRRSYINLKALGVRGLEFSPGWAVGSWFVPFVNLVRPYTIMKEIWTSSDSNNMAEGRPLAYTNQQTVPSMFGMWWAFWIISNFFANISVRWSFRATTLEDHVTVFWLDIVSSALSATAALLAINVVRAITARQRERHDRLQASQTQVNDPPPIAGHAVP